MKSRLPVLVRLVVRFLVPGEEREYFLGDLEESRRARWPLELLGALTLRLSERPRRRRTPAPRGDGMLRETLLDLRHGLRRLVRSPAFTGVALLTMALGIGANTAMFSIVHGVLLKPLPYPQADRIVSLRESNLSRGWPTFSVAPLNYLDWQERNRTMELLAAYQSGSAIYTGGDRPQTLPVFRASEDFLKILGGEPSVGRGITRADLEPGGAAVVLLSYGFWQRTFGGDPQVLGRTMVLDGAVHTVVGVLPGGWRPFSRSAIDLIVPLRPQPYWYLSRGSHYLYALGRLKPGVTLEQARSDFASIASALQDEYPVTNAGWGAVVTPLAQVVVGSTGPQLLVFMVAVGLVLLIACANLANMTLVRATGRTRELAIRTAMGAGRGRVVRQLVAESLLLAVLGGALGVILASAALKGFVTGWPTMLPRMQEIGMNAPVLLFSAGASVAAGILFGLVPALSVARADLGDVLRQGGRGSVGDRTHRWTRATLVTAEVGVAVVLLVGCGLLVRSFTALRGEDPGFRAAGRLVFSTPLSRARYTTPGQVTAFGDAALAGLAALPGAERVALTSLIPLEGSDNIWSYWIHGRTTATGDADGAALFYRVSPGYFAAMGIPLLAGRDIGTQDRADGRPVVVVSASLARQHFAGEDPVGRRIWIERDPDEPPVEIVGVVGDVQHYALGQTSMPQIYVPFTQRPSGNVNFVIKASVPPSSLALGVRRAIRAVDPDEPVVGMEEADAMIAGSIAMPRFRTLLMTGFGLTALLLAVVGLYGVMAYSVSQRTGEIGVRMALGATAGSILGLVLKEGARLVGIGLVVGMAGAFALSRILASMLFGVGARDPAVFVAVPLVLAAVAVVAMLIPARHASRVDPVRTLAEG
jgi:putative ABC transport system permease protein